MSIYNPKKKYYDTEFLNPGDSATELKYNEISFQSFWIKKYKELDNPFEKDGTYYVLSKIYENYDNVERLKITKNETLVYDLIEEIYEFRQGKL